MIDAEDKENDSNSQQSCTRPPPLEKANFDVDLANFCQTRRSVLKEFDPLYPASPCTKVNVENESGDQTKDKLETFPMVSITPNTELPISNQVEVKSGANAAANLTPTLVEDEKTSTEQSSSDLKPIPEPTATNTIGECKKPIVNAENESEARSKDKLAASGTVSITAHEELPESNQVEVESGADTAPNLTRLLVEDETSSGPSGSDTLGECRTTIVEAEKASGNRLKYKVETSAKVSMTLNEELLKSNQVEVQSGVDTAVHLTRILVEDETSKSKRETEQSGINLKPISEASAANAIGEYKKTTVNADNEREDQSKDKLEISATVSITAHEELPESNQVEVESGVDTVVNLTRVLVEDEISSEPSGSDTLGECTIVEAENASGNRLKYKVETSAKLILDEYEKRIAEQTKQLETLMSEKQATAKQFSNLELAFSDVFTRYEKLKVIIDKYKSNENILKLNLQSSEQALKLWEEKYQKLKKCSGDEVSRIALEKENITKEHEELHTSLRAMIKLLEIKCSSLETALMQKTRECRELEALCNDMSRTLGYHYLMAPKRSHPQLIRELNAPRHLRRTGPLLGLISVVLHLASYSL
ncbi:uncharacterized protein LOC132705255 isoform X2 [Cylas formicarius]|uniref:uncharacterized protein LOC132705255 isoform X2 n=1 Tax=Cylas formicarius TaxID=197179 RepID=UPI002958D723|nr:uncharacterized protein LOC132705255 isoform X2 [Cylas formicarius]